MPSAGLLALLDDIATIADDVATLTVAATKKTTGIVTDDMAVSAEQTIGIAREREIPVVLAVARGSLVNKLVLLAPGALFLNWLAPWVIQPILMAGGTFLCFEGVEKILHKVLPHDAHGAEHATSDEPDPEKDPVAFERMRVRGAIRTDLILSAEIIAITLGEVASKPLLTQAAVLYAVGILLTIGVYGLVGGLVKVDDLGAAMVQRGGSGEALGRAIVRSAPLLLHAISWIGTVAMLVVGGHILLQGIGPVEHAVHDWVHHQPQGLQGVLEYAAGAAFGAVCGLAVVAVVTLIKRLRGVH